MICVLRALCERHTYDFRRNRFLILGMILGVTAGACSLALILWGWGEAQGRGVHEAFGSRALLIFLAHPVIIGCLSGALGTARNELSAQALPTGELPPFCGVPHIGSVPPKPALTLNRGVFGPEAMMEAGHTVILVECHPESEDSRLRSTLDGLGFMMRSDPVPIPSGGTALFGSGTCECGTCLLERLALSCVSNLGRGPRLGVARAPEDGRSIGQLIEAAQDVLGGSHIGRHSPTCHCRPPAIGEIACPPE